jgi:hypothetical protein
MVFDTKDTQKLTLTFSIVFRHCILCNENRLKCHGNFFVLLGKSMEKKTFC